MIVVDNLILFLNNFIHVKFVPILKLQQQKLIN